MQVVEAGRTEASRVQIDNIQETNAIKSVTPPKFNS